MSDETKPTAPRKPRKPRKPSAAKSVASDERKQGSDQPVATGTSPGRNASRKPRAPKKKPAARAEAIGTVGEVEPQPVALIRVPMPVRWRDLDAFNHVNNSKYLSYLEEARLHWMLGVPGQGMDEHVAPVVAAAHLNYRRPIEWPNQVVIELFVERLGNTSVSIGHRITAADDKDVLFCDGNVVMVWIDRNSGQAAALPAAVRQACL